MFFANNSYEDCEHEVILGGGEFHLLNVVCLFELTHGKQGFTFSGILSENI